MRSISVVIVEDDPRLRKTLEQVLGEAEGCRCVGAFATVADAVQGIPSLEPDVILMDINLPDGTGVDCVASLAPQLPKTQILMLTAYQDPDTTFRAITAGARGYLVKPVKAARLVEAIREIREGGVPMSRTIARKVIEAFSRMNAGSRAAAPAQPPSAPSAASAPEDQVSLTPREQQVLELLVAGCSYKEAAVQLGIATSTVGVYVTRIYEKLHVSSRREIVAWSKAGNPAPRREA
jgi:DNA-binding NarL/FixJ family response regulator